MVCPDPQILLLLTASLRRRRAAGTDARCGVVVSRSLRGRFRGDIPAAGLRRRFHLQTMGLISRNIEFSNGLCPLDGALRRTDLTNFVLQRTDALGI
jgi:hypothetical protein